MISLMNANVVYADEISDIIENITDIAESVNTDISDDKLDIPDAEEITEDVSDESEAESEETTEEITKDNDDAEEIRYIGTYSVDIRKTDSNSAKSLGTAYWRDEVKILEEKGNWTKISYKKITGYVKTVVLKKKKPEINYKSAYTRYITKKVILRKAPFSDAKSAGTYEKAQKFTCYGTIGNWTVVKKSGKEYFILTKYLSETKPKTEDSKTRYIAVNCVRIRKTTSVSSKTLGKLYWKDEVKVLDTKGEWTKISYKEIIGYVKTATLTKKKPEVTYKSAYTRYTTKKVTIRKAPSSAATSAGSYGKGQKLTCYGTSGNWTLIKKNGKSYFVSTKSLSKTKTTSTDGEEVVAYAKKFIGNRYVWGGTSLTNGTDCSGFTQSVYRHFGYSLPRTSYEQRSSGKSVKLSDRQPGDLICYSGHIAIYIGNDKIVHASNSKPYPRGGIKISSMYIKKIKAVRRIVK
jgi:cell wall-associated NlpC family hydrolase